MPAEFEGVWDVHTHLIPELVVESARSGRFGFAIENDLLITDSARVPLSRISRPDLLSWWLEENRLSGGLVSPPPPMYRHDTDVEGWVQTLNDGMAEICASHSNLRPLAYLPAEDPRLSSSIARNLERAWAGVVLGTDLLGARYSDSEYDELWSVLEESEIPAFIHPGLCRDSRLADHYLTNLIGNPYETTVAAAHIIFGGVLSRHPGLKLILAHGGGNVANLIGRWSRAYETGRPGVADALTSSPREMARLFYVDSLVHDPRALRLVRAVFGDEKVLFGSDWPFPMGVDSFDDALGHWPGSRSIVKSNIEGLFG